MKRFEVQSIDILADYEEAFDYISNPKNLPEWTHAFHSVSNNQALMRTASGSVEVKLVVTASRESGNIDWYMKFPDGSQARAYSRLVEIEKRQNAYTFILTAPPVPLDQLEGALDQQSAVLKEELRRLHYILKGTK